MIPPVDPSSAGAAHDRSNWPTVVCVTANVCGGVDTVPADALVGVLAGPVPALVTAETW